MAKSEKMGRNRQTKLGKQIATKLEKNEVKF